MKRLGMVLLGLMFWSMNTLAQEDCGTPPRVLAPGKHSVLLFDQPFVVQWQDDDKCLGDMVKIEITETGPGGFSSQVLASETENKGRYEVWGDQLDDEGRYEPGGRRILISNAYDDSISIESKVFLIKTNGLENALSEQEMYYDKMEDMAIRDLLIRLTAMERQTGYVEDDNEAWDDSGDTDLKGGQVRRARKKTKQSVDWSWVDRAWFEKVLVRDDYILYRNTMHDMGLEPMSEDSFESQRLANEERIEQRIFEKEEKLKAKEWLRIELLFCPDGSCTAIQAAIENESGYWWDRAKQMGYLMHPMYTHDEQQAMRDRELQIQKALDVRACEDFGWFSWMIGC